MNRYCFLFTRVAPFIHGTVTAAAEVTGAGIAAAAKNFDSGQPLGCITQVLSVQLIGECTSRNMDTPYKNEKVLGFIPHPGEIKERTTVAGRKTR